MVLSWLNPIGPGKYPPRWPQSTLRVVRESSTVVCKPLEGWRMPLVLHSCFVHAVMCAMRPP